MINCNCTSWFRHCKNPMPIFLLSCLSLWKALSFFFSSDGSQDRKHKQDNVSNKNPDIIILIENIVCRLCMPSFPFCFWLALSFMLLSLTFSLSIPFNLLFLPLPCLPPPFLPSLRKLQKRGMKNWHNVLVLRFYRKTVSEWSRRYSSSARKKKSWAGMSAFWGLYLHEGALSVAALPSHTIHFSAQMTLYPHFCFPFREGLTPSLIAAINILTQGPFKM